MLCDAPDFRFPSSLRAVPSITTDSSADVTPEAVAMMRKRAAKIMDAEDWSRVEGHGGG